MEVVRVEGEELEPDEFGEGSGWCEIKRHSKNQQQGQQQTAATSLTETSTAAGTAVKYNRKTARQVRQIARASRMPDLPTDDYKVVVRPRGGFNVSDYKMDRIYCCLRSAAEIGREAAEEDSICLNFKQNIVVLSTPNPPHEHLCDPKCQLCGKGHVTGDRKCKAKYKIPYLVKRRQWERRTREEDAAVEAYDNGYNSSSTANYASQDRHLRREGRSASRGAIGGAGKSRSRSSARSRSRSLTGSRASKPRSKSKMRAAAGPGAMQPTGFEVSWADVAASPGGDGAAGRRDGVVVNGGGGPGPGRPVPVEVNTVDDSSVETADEREDHPVSSKRAALDPERPTTEPRSTSYERLKKRIENIETSLDERFASQTEQINKMFTVVNNSVAKLAEQMTQAIAALTARMDDFEARPPPLAGRSLRATGKPYARPQQQQTPITDAETQHQQPRAEAETTASCVDRRYGDVAGRRGARSSQSNSGAASDGPDVTRPRIQKPKMRRYNSGAPGDGGGRGGPDDHRIRVSKRELATLEAQRWCARQQPRADTDRKQTGSTTADSEHRERGRPRFHARRAPLPRLPPADYKVIIRPQTAASLLHHGEPHGSCRRRQAPVTPYEQYGAYKHPIPG
ncbi:hypothetical protein HPB52_010337 [Rhipicephalus sanguineus]|uniref:Uncharacterized protein n=1 Tax=Rhipicephalus sanguineus TaxID=34632 RepID=A0A9D4SMQ2_RHISA|nr:hypothetical protein HPB52_010337 [Rhipicephalus sanguineus]